MHDPRITIHKPRATRVVKVKICGVTTVEDARFAAAAGAWAIGLNFFPRSVRCVAVQTAEAIVAVLPRQVWRVGVFVDAPRQLVEELAERLQLDAVQFHGEESVDYCRRWRPRVIKAVRARDRDVVARVAGYPVDFFLVDAYAEGVVGGTGRTVPWEWLAGIDRDRLILAGGLTPENVAAAVRVVRPLAVDVASGVERSPGRKDPERVKRFMLHAQSA